MLPSFVRRLTLAVLFTSASISQGQNINWDVAAGKCTDDDLETISGWFDDADALIEAALRAVGEKDTGNEEILTFFSSYFGIKWDYSTPGAFIGRESEIIFGTVKCKRAWLTMSYEIG